MNPNPMPSEPSSEVKFEIGHVLFIDIVGYSKLVIVGIAQSLTAGSMNFASSPVALRSSKGSGVANGRVDGILGLLGGLVPA